MMFLTWSSLRHRKAGFAGAFVALFCAAALVCACGMLMDTGLRGSVAPERYKAAPIVVSGDLNMHIVKHKGSKTKVKSKPVTERPWLPAGLADKVRTVSGVRSVVPELTFAAYLGGRPVAESWGHAWRSAVLTPFTLASGRAPQRSDEIVVDAAARLRTGTTTAVQTGSGIASYRVVGVTAQSLPDQRAIFFNDAEARRLAGHDGSGAVLGVFGTASPAALKTALAGTGATVHTGTGRGQAEFPNTGAVHVKLTSMGGALGGTALVVAILAVTGTFALAGLQRRRELALLRAVAATPRQIRRMIGREALLVGLLAAVPGAAAGIALGFWLHDRFVGLDVIPRNMPLVVSPFPPLVAIAATLLAGWAAARISARKSARIRPVEALGDAALAPPRIPVIRVVAGLVAIAGGVLMTLVLSTVSTDKGGGPLTPLTALVWVLAVALLGPLLSRVTLGLLSLPLRGAGAGGHLAAANLRTGALRMAAVITPLTLMIGLACTLLFSQTTTDQAAAREARTGITADYVAGPKVPTPAADAVRKVPGVRAVTEVLHTTVRTSGSGYTAQGVTPAGLGRTMDLGVKAGSLDRLTDGTMAVRDRLGMKVGDQIQLKLGDGTPVTLRVVAVYSRGLGFAQMTLPYDLVAAHVDNTMNDTVLVSAPGVSQRSLAAALQAYPAVHATSPAAAPHSDGSAVNYIALGLIIAFAAISAGNTLALATIGRFREFALLRLVGATRRQLRWMLTWETLAVLAVATVLGSVIAVVTLTAYSSAMADGRLALDPLAYLAILGGTALLALLATFLPTRPAGNLTIRE